MMCKLFREELSPVFVAQNCVYCPLGIDKCQEQEDYYEVEGSQRLGPTDEIPRSVYDYITLAG